MISRKKVTQNVQIGGRACITTRPVDCSNGRTKLHLSAMRARQVLLYFIAPVDEKDGGGGLNPNQLHAAGYGETDPVGENESDEGRQANRRVELVIMPDVEEMLDLKELI